MRFRPTLVSLHRWIGLAVGVFLLVQGLTGAAMVFRDELNRALHHDALIVIPAGPTIPVQTLADKVRALRPDLQIRRIEFPKGADDAFWFRLEAPGGGDIHYVSVDPYRGTITRDGPLSRWPAHWLFELHHQVLLGAPGDTVIGIEGAALLFLAIVGVLLWWPGRAGVRRSFKVKLSASGYRSVRDLHRVGGLLIALVLATSAITGMLVVWRTEVQSVVQKFVPLTPRPSPQVARRADVPLLPIDTFVATARAKYSDALIKSVRFPGGHGRVLAVYLQASGTTRPRATDQLWFDGYTGATLATYDAGAVSSGTRFFDWMLPIHTGQAFGIAGRILFLLAALTLVGLSVTGFLQWWWRRV